MAPYLSKIINNTFGFAESKQIRPNIQPFPFILNTQEEHLEEIQNTLENHEDSSTSTVSENIVSSNDTNIENEIQIIEEPQVPGIKKEITTDKPVDVLPTERETENIIQSDPGKSNKTSEQKTILDKNTGNNIEEDKGILESNIAETKYIEKDSILNTINVTKQVSSTKNDKRNKTEKSVEPIPESKLLDKKTYQDKLEDSSSDEAEKNHDFYTPVKERVDKVSKDIVEIVPQEPVIQPPSAKIKHGKRLVIGQINVEVVQEQKEKTIQKETIIKYKPATSGENPISMTKGSTLKIKYGLGQL